MRPESHRDGTIRTVTSSNLESHAYVFHREQLASDSQLRSSYPSCDMETGGSSSSLCGCGRSFLQPSAMSNHQRTCPNTKKRFSNALTKAREAWTQRKKCRLDVSPTSLPEVAESASRQLNQVSFSSYLQVKANRSRRKFPVLGPAILVTRRQLTPVTPFLCSIAAAGRTGHVSFPSASGIVYRNHRHLSLPRRSHRLGRALQSPICW